MEKTCCTGYHFSGGKRCICFSPHNAKICKENTAIRDDIFGILENQCTVVYFPIEDKKNRGFHIKKMQFVTSKEGRKSILVLICLVKKSNFGCKVMNEICIDGLDTYQNIFKK